MRKEKHNDEGFITIDCHIIIGRPQGKGEAQTHRVTLCVCVCVCVCVFSVLQIFPSLQMSVIGGQSVSPAFSPIPPPSVPDRPSPIYISVPLH